MMLPTQNGDAAAAPVFGVDSDVHSIQRRTILFCLALPDSYGNTAHKEGM